MRYKYFVLLVFLAACGTSETAQKARASVSKIEADLLGIELINALANHQVSLAREKIAAGANLNIKNEHGVTSLGVAGNLSQCGNQVINIIKEMVIAGADPHIPGFLDGTTVLMLAASRRQEELCLWLIDTGKVDIFQGDNNGETAISWAAFRGLETVVKKLIALGASIHVKYAGLTVLSNNVMGHGKNHDIILFLLGNRADINCISENTGNTPLLHIAECHLKTAVLLLYEGAQRHIKNKAGENIYDLAKTNANLKEILDDFEGRLAYDKKIVVPAICDAIQLPTDVVNIIALYAQDDFLFPWEKKKQ